jgi:hypothetical protein
VQRRVGNFGGILEVDVTSYCLNGSASASRRTAYYSLGSNVVEI